jgi:hypothetical protein
MAKKKRRKISGTRRRKSRSLSGNIDTQNLLGIVVGAVAAGYVNKLIPATVNDKITSAAKIGIGIALPMFIKNGSMAGLARGAGAGFVAVGSVDLLKSMGALSGDFDIPVINGDVLGADVLSGEDDIPVINGIDDEDQMLLNGLEDED